MAASDFRIVLCALGTMFFACAEDPKLEVVDQSNDAADALALQVSSNASNAPVLGKAEAFGRGCPPGTWKVEPEVRDPLLNGAFTITFERFSATLSATTSAAQATTNCHITVPISSPKGLQYAVTRFRFRGYALLQPNVEMLHMAEYRFVGTPAVASPHKIEDLLSGPYDKGFSFEHSLSAADPGRINWSACTKQATILLDTAFILRSPKAPSASSLLNVEAIDGHGIEVTVAAKECPL